MYRVTINSAGAEQMLAKLKAGMRPEAIDPVVERVAFKTLADLVRNTPKRFFGQVRRDWRVEKRGLGSYTIENPNKIMWFLEHGTGQSTGGFIYPKTAKALFVALTRRAALASKNSAKQALKYGVDYVLARRVRGIAARRIVGAMRAKAEADMLTAMKAHLRRIVATK